MAHLFAAIFLSWGMTCAQLHHDVDLQACGFEFIRFGSQGPLLTLYKDACYFSSLVFSPLPAVSDWEATENMVVESLHAAGITKLDECPQLAGIRHGYIYILQPTTLDAMRDEYAGRLADVHCYDKPVF